MKRDLLSLRDLTKEEIYGLFDKSRTFKMGDVPQSLKNKAVALVFEKASTRTRISFEVGVSRLGGHPVVLMPGGSQMARGEPLKDTARVLNRYCDMIVMRTYAHSNVEEMARYTDVPVINALTDLLHPCQVLADCFTIIEKFGSIEDRKVAWLGDGFNMANSWINAAAILGFELMLACPRGYEPDVGIMDRAVREGAKVSLVSDPMLAVKGASAVNTDVWASMGQEEETLDRVKAFDGYKVTSEIMDHALPDAVFMHCLPAHRDEEVSEEVFEGPRSIVWDQTENRLYVQEAVMDFLASHK
jgi:ornithine carbamoyltransferase